MSSIFDYETQSVGDEFPLPDNHNLPDDEDMNPGDKAKHMLKSDWKIVSLRGTKDAGEAGQHVINIRLKAVNNDDYDGGGEVTKWFRPRDMEGTFADITRKQVASYARLVVSLGLVNEDAFDGTDGLDAVQVIIDSLSRFDASAENYTFNGTVQLKKECSKKNGQIYWNYNLFFNTYPKAPGDNDVPF